MINLIEYLLNKHIQQDSELMEEFSNLDDKKIHIQINDLAKTIVIHWQKDFLNLDILNSATIDSQDDFAAKISGSSLEFYKLLKKSNSIQELNLKLEGNINVAQNLNTLFLKINIDWGKILIPYIGESCGPQLANLIQTISRQTKSKFNSMTQMLNDYLIEEAQLTPAKWEVEEFIQEVNQFKHDLERLTARINYALSATNSQTN